MPKFKFYIDTKVASWTRDEYTFQAIDERKAIEYMKSVFNGNIPIEDMPVPDNTYHIENAGIVIISPHNNDDEATIELIMVAPAGEDITICDNAIPPTQNPHV